MKVTEVKYSKRFNDGNYEHTEISIGAQVDGSKENVTECLVGLKDIVYAARVNGDTSQVEIKEDAQDEVEEVKEEKPKRQKKQKVEEPEEVEEEEVQEEEAPEEVEEQEEVEEEEEKPKKKFKSKASTYDRTNEVHREIFVSVVKGIDPKWNSSDIKKARAKKVSQLMTGEEFLDAEGEVLPAFVKETKKALLGK